MSLAHKNLLDKPTQEFNGDDIPDDPHLIDAVQEYLKLLEQGVAPSRADFLRRYPDISEALAQCLDGLELVYKPALRSNPTSDKLAIGGHDDGLPANPLGDFQIVREIGRGGMGVVYEAIQLSLGRRVALKVLPFAATFDAKHLQRFRNEAQAAALLHHTNIVPVYAVGCERGVHFYAMQLIDGQTLATVLDQIRPSDESKLGQQTGPAGDLAGIVEDHSASTSNPRPLAETVSPISASLATSRANSLRKYYRAIARFIVQAAEALEHAHQFGIIHRDIKPGNLLVDAHGRVWITDFGLAQFHADAGLTRTGDILGTLRYMSPEQASGQRVLLDHRTDIYSLGATLYQLATLQPLFSGHNQQELLHQILHEDPRLPRSVDNNVPVELETIILKAVSKHPNDRYPTAAEMAADLQRFLDDKPILAKRPGLIERVRKWGRRHPSIAIAAMILLFFGAVGFGISSYMIAGAYNREKQRAIEAENRFKQAKRSVDEMIQIAQEELAGNPQMRDVRRRLLEAALAYYQEFIEQRSDDPVVEAELKTTRDLIRTIIDELVVLQGAGRHLLLKEPAVLDDLKPSEEQRQRIADLLQRQEKRHQETFDEIRRLGIAERQKHMLKIVRANETETAAILTPEQQDRLAQISRQCQGPMAFNDPEVSARLKLTNEQKKEIRTLEAGMLFMPPPGERKKNAGLFGQMHEEKRKTVMAQIQTLLTPEQARRWSELTGRPFEAAGRIFFPGSMPPPPAFGPLPGKLSDLEQK
jgi:serine/threonine protein kinase